MGSVADQIEQEEKAGFTEVIVGRLFQSGRPVPREIVEAREVNAIVSVSGGEQPWIEDWMEAGGDSLKPGRPQQRIRAQVPLIDASNWLDEAAADAAIRLVLRLLYGDDTRRVLVHCDAGAFRSVHVAACVLAEMQAVPAPLALAEIDKGRGRTPPRNSLGLPGWNEHLLTWGPADPPTPDPPAVDDGRADG